MSTAAEAVKDKNNIRYDASRDLFLVRKTVMFNNPLCTIKSSLLTDLLHAYYAFHHDWMASRPIDGSFLKSPVPVFETDMFVSFEPTEAMSLHAITARTHEIA